jgi:hypothetical protein
VGISWLPPAQPVALAAGLVAVAVAPDGRPAGQAAVAAGAPDAAVARLPGAAEALALLPVAPDAAVVAVVLPGAVARLAEFPASAGPAERAWQPLPRVWMAAATVEPRLIFASFPERLGSFPERLASFRERRALAQGPEPNRQPSADPPEALAHSDHRWPASPPAEFEGQVSYREWSSAIHGPEAPRQELRW